MTVLAGLAGLASVAPGAASATSLPTGERSHGSVSVEPAYDDTTGQIIYLQTPDHLAPLGPHNANNVNPSAVAPLYLIVYPPGTSGTFNCMGVPGNCPDHDSTIAGVASAVQPQVYGTDPSAVPGHDHLVGVARTKGDFNVAWHVYVEVFTSSAAVTHITTLTQLQDAVAAGSIQQVDSGITFICSVVSQASYDAGTPVGG
ncbi:MAG TPA: hypothetical protein VKI19_04980 [Acidimicrobiales bacterium]|nr:hypothetical protein [Acidimicrobiales bacterium]